MKKAEIKRSENLKNYIFLHLLILMLSCCGILSKLAATQELLSFGFFAFYGAVIVLMAFYALFWQQIIKKIPLTVAFCNKSVSIIWGMIWGALFFHETIKWNMILGAAIVIVGVILVVKSDE